MLPPQLRGRRELCRAVRMGCLPADSRSGTRRVQKQPAHDGLRKLGARKEARRKTVKRRACAETS